MNTIKELNLEANRIVSEVFNKEDFQIINVSVSVILNTYTNGKLYLSSSYFVKSKTRSINTHVDSESYESLLEKLKIKANLDKDFSNIEAESKGKPTVDIEFGI